MRAEFYRADDRQLVVASARFGERGVEIVADDGRGRDVLERVFRPAPVLIDDPAMRSAGSAGPTVLTPGSLDWFQAAARTRGETEGLGVRFVPDEGPPMGWDPAGAYRTFSEALDRKVRLAGSGGGGSTGARPAGAGPGGEAESPAP